MWVGGQGHPTTPPSPNQTQSSTTLILPLFDFCSQTDQQKDKASYRVACLQLKIQMNLTNNMNEIRTFIP